MDHRKNWTIKQDILRKALSSRARFGEALELFLDQHAAVHTKDISGNKYWSLHDDVLSGLGDEMIRKVPKAGQNSIAWLLWHITRIEDMTINTLTMDQSQVWNENWANKLGYSLPDCGAGMIDAEVEDFSQRIDVGSLLEYRSYVGQRTRLSVINLDADAAKMPVPAAVVQKLVDEGSINKRADWLYQFYLDRTRGFFLTRTATSHNFVHLNEAGRTAEKLKKLKFPPN